MRCAQFAATSSEQPRLMCNYDVIYKPDIYNISLRRQRRTEPRKPVTCTKIGEDRVCIVPEICVRTGRQTDMLITILRHPYRDGVMYRFKPLHLLVFVRSPHEQSGEIVRAVF